MKQLFICRHSKSESFGGSKPDRERELTLKGKDDATAVGVEFARRRIVPDLILASDSVRTRQTTSLIVAQLASDPRTEFLPDLYSASAGEVLDVILDRAEGLRSILVVGHNPGLEDLVSRIAGRDVRLRTSTVAILETGDGRTSEPDPVAGLHLTDLFGPREH